MKQYRLNTAILLVFLMLWIGIEAQTQLKSFDIMEISAPEYVIYTKHPECAVISVESAIRNLHFKSNMEGIVDQEYRRAENRYVIYLRPIRQKISVQHPDYRETEVKMLTGLKAKDTIAFIISEEMGTGLKGTLIIESEPPGAEITIDGIPSINQRTPVTLPDLRALQYRITLSNYRHQDSTFVAKVRENQVNKYFIKFKPAFGNISISSNPPNARIYINDRLKGMTPLNLHGKEDGLDAGIYRIRVEAENYGSLERQIQIRADHENAEHFDLVPQFGNLSVFSEPSGADVYIGSQLMGTTPLALDRLRVGSHEVRVVPPTDIYREEIHQIEVTPGAIIPLRVYFMASSATLRISSNLSPFQAHLNNVLNPELSNGREIQVAARTHEIRVVYTGKNSRAYDPYTESVTLVAGEKRIVNPTFQSNLIKATFVSDLPYTGLEVYGIPSRETYYNDILRGEIELPPGNYQIVASKSGYLSYFSTITIEKGDNPRYEMSLMPKNALNMLSSNPALVAPRNLRITNSDSSGRTLVWDSPNTPTYFVIDRKRKNGNWESGVAFVSGNLRTWLDQNTKESNLYRICSFQDDQISGFTYNDPNDDALYTAIEPKATITKEIAPEEMALAIKREPADPKKTNDLASKNLYRNGLSFSSRTEYSSVDRDTYTKPYLPNSTVFYTENYVAAAYKQLYVKFSILNQVHGGNYENELLNDKFYDFQKVRISAQIPLYLFNLRGSINPSDSDEYFFGAQMRFRINPLYIILTGETNGNAGKSNQFYNNRSYLFDRGIHSPIVGINPGEIHHLQAEISNGRIGSGVDQRNFTHIKDALLKDEIAGTFYLWGQYNRNCSYDDNKTPDRHKEFSYISGNLAIKPHNSVEIQVGYRELLVDDDESYYYYQTSLSKRYKQSATEVYALCSIVIPLSDKGSLIPSFGFMSVEREDNLEYTNLSNAPESYTYNGSLIPISCIYEHSFSNNVSVYIKGRLLYETAKQDAYPGGTIGISLQY